MRTFTKSTLLSIATLALAFTGYVIQAQAQQPQILQQFPVTQPQYVAPVVAPQPQPQQQNEFYFGISVQLIANTYGGKTLRIVSVSPGSPSQQAGLELGDEIRSINGQGFEHAQNSFDAVNMMSRFVSSTPVGGGPAPAAAANATARSYVGPGIEPTASMVVRNVRNGQDVSVTVRPQRRSVGGPIRIYAPNVAAP